MEIKTLQSFIDFYKDEPENQKQISDYFIEMTNSIPELKKYRDWIEQNVYGFGEREFHFLWYLILLCFKEKNNGENIKLIELGVFRGQILGAWGLIAKLIDCKVKRYGITPLTPIEIGWESDYKKDIQTLHNTFDIPCDYHLFEDVSQNEITIKLAKQVSPFDVLYIDASHEYNNVKSDLENYLPMIKSGGILVIDDSCNSLNSCYSGRFWGIADVTRAVDELLPPFTENKDFTFIGNVIHNRIYIKN